MITKLKAMTRIRTILTLTSFFVISGVYAQLKLLATTSGGGVNGNGSLFTYNVDANEANADSVFWQEIEGNNPHQELTDGENGKIYGVTVYGGSGGNGVLFSIDTASHEYEILINFDNSSAQGGSPNGGLVLIGGKLYGTTRTGGTNSKGILYSYEIATSNFVKLYDFATSTGSSPYSGVIEASNGKLYGTTLTGGGGPSSGDGCIYEYDINTSTYTMVATFSENSAKWPRASLVEASDGKFYGVASDGTNGVGYIFSYDATMDTLTVLEGFSTTIADNPSFALIQASDNNLYGLSFYGGSTNDGTIYGYNMTTESLFHVMDFTGNSTGENATGVLFEGDGQRLYGVTDNGGGNFWGALFYYDLSNSTYNIVYDFDEDLGRTPSSGLINLNGKFYGVTSDGGAGQDGVVYSFDTTTTDYEVLVHMGATAGNFPNSQPTLYSGSIYYGMARGGSNGNGVIYGYDVSTGEYNVIHNFNGDDGDNPFGRMLLASDGVMYGLTFSGGANNVGVIFSFDPTDSSFTKLQDLSLSTGSAGANEFIELGDGKLYTTTVGGGANGVGAIISYDPVSDILSTVHSFVDDGTGKTPRGALIEASDGLLYGTTSAGGINDRGTIFSYNLGTSTHTKLHDFENDMGQVPYTQMIEANGMLYGTAGGLNFFDFEAGVLFGFDISASTYEVVYDFSTSGSTSGSGRLLLASDGNIYGMLGNKIFSLDTATHVFTEIYTMTGDIGSGPAEAGLIEVSCDLPVATTFSTSTTTVCTGQSGVSYVVDNSQGNTYSWSYDGAGATITEANHMASIDYGSSATSGNLTVDATNSCGSLNSAASEAITVTVCTGIDEEYLSVVKVYPNPSQGTITIYSDHSGALVIQSITGAQVHNKEITGGESYTINSLKSGVYIVSIKTDAGISTAKIIVE